MDMEKTGTRRTFLKGAALLGALAMLLGLPRPSRSAPEAPRQSKDAPGSGYRLTEHVKKYYESAKL